MEFIVKSAIFRRIFDAKNKNITQLIFYVFFAGVATICDFGLLYILTDLLNVKYIVSSAISYIVGMVVNYTLNKFFNFRDKNKKIASQFTIFVGVALVGLALNQIIICVLVETFKVWYMTAKVVSVLAVMFWSFWGHKNFTFKLQNLEK